MPKEPSAADELYSQLRTERVLRGWIKGEHDDCSRRVEEAQKEMRKIEKKLGGKELLVKYGRLMNEVERDGDTIEEKDCDIQILDKTIAKLNILIKEEKATNNPAESAEAQQSSGSRERLGRGNREVAGHRV